MRPLFIGYETHPSFDGTWPRQGRIDLDAESLVQHAFVCGATGYGKTVLCKGIVEEAVRQSVPVVVVDFKGDLASLALTGRLAERDVLSEVFGQERGDSIARGHHEGLARDRAVASNLGAYARRVHPRIITPRSSIGIRVAQEGLPTFVGIPDDPVDRQNQAELTETLVKAFARTMYASSREMKRNEEAVKLMEELCRYCQAEGVELQGLDGIQTLRDLVLTLPIDNIAGLPIDAFLSESKRLDLVRSLTSRMSGAERAHYEGEPLSMSMLLEAPEGKTPLNIVSLAHISSFQEQARVVAQLCTTIYRWMRRKGSSKGLGLLLYIDELGHGDNKHSFYPSGSYDPPSKAPLTLLVKQGRSAGVGVLLATQNPMSVDVRGLGNVSTRGVGRLTQRNDQDRVLDSVTYGGIRQQVSALPPGVFFCSSPGLTREHMYLHERWLYSVHCQLAQDELRRLSQRLAAMSPEMEAPAGGHSRPTNEAEPAPSPPRDDSALYRTAHGFGGDEGATVMLDEAEPSEEATQTIGLGPQARQWHIKWPDGDVALVADTTSSVGRSRSASIKIDDSTISRIHLTLEVQGDQVLVTPEGKNPTRLNGDALGRAQRLDGEDGPFQLQAGRTHLTLSFE